MIGSLSAETFAPHVGTRFALSVDDLSLELELERVDALGGAIRKGGAFSLLFLGPKDPVLPQRIYRLDHRATGRLELFLVPVGATDGGLRYEAVFT